MMRNRRKQIFVKRLKVTRIFQNYSDVPHSYRAPWSREHATSADCDTVTDPPNTFLESTERSLNAF